MKEIIVNTSDLKKSAANVRAGHSKEDINAMANSIKANGIINPPTVVKNGKGYQVIAGQLRVAGAILAGEESIRCLDATDLPEEQRVAVSLSENFVRRDMSEIETFRAFHQLFKAGVSVDDIAEQFTRTPEEVQRTLAIGGLPKKILDAAENDEIGNRTLRALACASKADVTRYAKLAKKDRPLDWHIHDWLYKEGRYLAKHALFDLTSYDGPIITDLFSNEDEQWLTDGKQFWDLQKACIETDLNDLKDLGWKVTEVDYFSSYEYDKTAKKDGGQVFYRIDYRTGAVEYHKGYKRKAKAGAQRKAEGEGTKTETPEISQAFDNFMAETRHAAVQHQLVFGNVTSGLVGTLLLLLKQADNISFRPGGKALGDSYNDSLHSGDNFIQVHDKYTEMLSELGIKDGWTWDLDINKVGKKLEDYTPAQLRDWIILTVAYNWDCDIPKNGDQVGKAIGLTEVCLWEADEAFWNGIKNKKTLIAIAKETGVPIDVNATTKVIRAILQEKVPNDWRPKWLKF